jgi:hypothetical protein
MGVTVVKLRIQPSTYPIVFLISLVLDHQVEEVTACMSARMGHARREWLAFKRLHFSMGSAHKLMFDASAKSSRLAR